MAFSPYAGRPLPSPRASPPSRAREMWLLAPPRLPGPCLLRSLVAGGKGWQCWALAGGGPGQVGVGWWGHKPSGSEKGRETPGPAPGRLRAGAVLVGSSSSRRAAPQVKRTCPPTHRRASNLCLFLPHPPVAIPFCRVSNCAARAKRRVEQGQSGWDLRSGRGHCVGVALGVTGTWTPGLASWWGQPAVAPPPAETSPSGV